MAEETTEISKPFNAANLAEQLRDKIRVDMATLMPDEMWQALLQKEIETFFESREVEDGYNRRKKVIPSVLHEVVSEVLREETKKRVLDMLQTQEWSGFWDGQRQKAGVKIEQLVKENASEILSAVLSESIQGVVSAMQANMANRY